MSTPNPEPSGPPLRALAMVLISLAILFAAIGALSLTGSSDADETAAPPQATTTEAAAEEPAETTDAAPTTTTAPPTSVDPADIDLRVLNNSNVSGLAADTAATLTSGGWVVGETGNYSDSQIPSTTVYFGSEAGAEAAAQDIAELLGATAQATPATLTGFGNGVVVMVTQ